MVQHFFPSVDQITESEIGKGTVDRVLNQLPDVARRAIDRVGAGIFNAGMGGTEIIAEKLATEIIEHLADDDLVSGPGKKISTGLAATAVDKPGNAQDAAELGNIMLRKPFRFADFRDSQAIRFFAAGDADKNPQAIFFLCTDFHRTVLPAETGDF